MATPKDTPIADDTHLIIAKDSRKAHLRETDFSEVNLITENSKQSEYALFEHFWRKKIINYEFVIGESRLGNHLLDLSCYKRE